MSQTVRAAAYAPDGTEITWTRPPNKWGVAGIARRNGQWADLAHGNSHDSVRSRAITQAYRWSYDRGSVRAVRIWEATAPAVREYFGHHKVNITDIFRDGTWRSARLHGGWSSIRKLSLQGVTAIAFEGVRDGDGGPRVADFQVSELLASMRLPKQKMCATASHSHIPATHKISYSYRGEDERTTELVCSSCEESYSRHPVLADFDSIPLAR